MRWVGIVLFFIAVLFFMNLIAAAVVGVLILKGVEVPAIIPFPVAVIGAILVFYKLVKKRNILFELGRTVITSNCQTTISTSKRSRISRYS